MTRKKARNLIFTLREATSYVRAIIHKTASTHSGDHAVNYLAIDSFAAGGPFQGGFIDL